MSGHCCSKKKPVNHYQYSAKYEEKTGRGRPKSSESIDNSQYCVQQESSEVVTIDDETTEKSLEEPALKTRKDDKTSPRKTEILTRRQISEQPSTSTEREEVPKGNHIEIIEVGNSPVGSTHSSEDTKKSNPTDDEVILIEEDSDEKSEEDSADEGPLDRRREVIKQKKQVAIAKCRAVRLEKLAKAAEARRKRQEQAAQQREARRAAEEAEKAAIEKARATKRYGRYGIPKPQISLVDAPVEETAGTVKGYMGQPGQDDNETSVDQLVSLKNLEVLKPSPQKLLSTPVEVHEEPAAVKHKQRSLATEDVVMLDEDTRMSADFRGSRSQTPAKQTVVLPAEVEDSQSSIGTEVGKSRSSKAPKMEVYQDLESTIITADQLAEYTWNGQGPFMLQEQVTQFLGIKSFKRKYPNVSRRSVDMQERDYLKENGLATEAQCDLGLTAVVAQDILDIMYSDFQDKYEDYCKAQREKQAKEFANKQKALNQYSQRPGFDKLDILEQAVQSAASWNQKFNKARREQRRAAMDLQNMIIHYPKNRLKVVQTPKIGHYPVALVPGQFIDHFKQYTPTEINNLPVNTMCYDEIKIPGFCTESDYTSSDSDSESDSNSASSSSESSCEEDNCRECVGKKKKPRTIRETDSNDVMLVENDASSSDSVVLVSVTAAPCRV